ncbi:hypothetical protein HN51_028189, partial [Arachis hypogaea]
LSQASSSDSHSTGTVLLGFSLYQRCLRRRTLHLCALPWWSLSLVKVLGENNINVPLILEASDRIGGRIWKETFTGISIELGAEWIAGVGGKGTSLTEVHNAKESARAERTPAVAKRSTQEGNTHELKAPLWQHFNAIIGNSNILKSKLESLPQNDKVLDSRKDKNMAIKPTVALRAILVGGVAAFAKMAGAIKAASVAVAAITVAATTVVAGSKQEQKMFLNNLQN